MRVLVMGGTRFIGVYLTQLLVEQGHEVVLFNRGNRPAPVEGVGQITGDRTNLAQMQELSKEHFDAIFDVCFGLLSCTKKNCNRGIL